MATAQQQQTWHELAQQLRVDSIRSTTAAKSGHPTSSMSAADLMAVLLCKYFHYDFDGHWKRNYPIYLESLKKKKKKDNAASEGMLDMLVIETNYTISFTFSWIMDFGSSDHLCTSIWGLEKSRRLREGE